MGLARTYTAQADVHTFQRRTLCLRGGWLKPYHASHISHSTSHLPHPTCHIPRGHTFPQSVFLCSAERRHPDCARRFESASAAGLFDHFPNIHAQVCMKPYSRHAVDVTGPSLSMQLAACNVTPSKLSLHIKLLCLHGQDLCVTYATLRHSNVGWQEDSIHMHKCTRAHTCTNTCAGFHFHTPTRTVLPRPLLACTAGLTPRARAWMPEGKAGAALRSSWIRPCQGGSLEQQTQPSRSW